MNIKEAEMPLFCWHIKVLVRRLASNRKWGLVGGGWVVLNCKAVQPLSIKDRKKNLFFFQRKAFEKKKNS